MFGYRRKAGDWKCNHCGKDNFARRSSCFGCNRNRNGGGEHRGRPGDWNCPNCNDHQFASRTQCRKCGTSKVGGAPAGPVLREGDWNCPRCTKHQFARNKFCRDCGSANPGNEQTEEQLLELEEGEDCIVCMDAKKNATFIHGTSGHTACCLPCAQMVLANHGKCSICMQPIEKVIQNFA